MCTALRVVQSEYIYRFRNRVRSSIAVSWQCLVCDPTSFDSFDEFHSGELTGDAAAWNVLSAQGNLVSVSISMLAAPGL